MPSYARDTAAPFAATGLALRTATASLPDDHALFPDVHAATQTTIVRSIRVSGKGLHTGRSSTVTLHPAKADHGIVFRRKTKDGFVVVPALWTRRNEQPMCTAIMSSCGLLVRTVEHLLATLSAFEIDNVLVDIVGEELPIFDGSAEPWCKALAEAGRRELGSSRRVIEITKTFEHLGNSRHIRIEPSPALSVDVRIGLQHFGQMRWDGAVTSENFRREIAPSRSFGRLKWALPTKIYGLVTRKPILKGANFRTTAALVGGRIVGGGRFPDEPVRHRVLDLLGDLALAGMPIRGHVTAISPGHDVNYDFLERLMAAKDCWRVV